MEKKVRRFLFGTRRRRLLSVLFAALLTTVLVGAVAAGLRGSSSSTSPPPSPPSAALGDSTEPSSEGSCTTGPAEADVRVTVWGGGEDACARMNREAAASSESFWRTLPAGHEIKGELVCSMTNGGPLIEVRDTGSHYYGNRICARLTAKGWHEHEGPGEKVERARETHEAEEKAAAEQRAAAEHAEAERKREAEQKKEEAQREAGHKREEAQQKAEQAAQERRSQEETRRSEEETRRGERESEAASH
jgi:hypothetical protein